MGVRSSQPRSPNLNKTDGHLLEYFRNTFVAGGGGTNAPVRNSGFTATGGFISDYSDSGTIYRAHIFTSSGTFNITAGGDYDPAGIEYLVVGGGGAGGDGSGNNGTGGGGAGGLRTNLSGHPLSGGAYPIPGSFPAPYTVTIGAGGVSTPTDGQQGNNTEFYPPSHNSYPAAQFIRGAGGGGGGNGTATAGLAGGGSGGGKSAQAHPGGSNAVGAADPNHPETAGYAGGSGYGIPSFGGGGGGGAGGVGGDGQPGPAPDTNAGEGGAGIQVLIAGSPTNPQPVGGAGPGSGAAATGWFAGGGGAGTADAPNSNNRGGYGGGGRPAGESYAGGGNGTSGNGDERQTSGDANTGGGGGGGRTASAGTGNGGSGIVVVRYQIGSVESAKATGGSISFTDTKTVHVFTTTQPFQVTSGPITCDYLVVGGGGAGGLACGGGGGAGGYRSSFPEGPGGPSPSSESAVAVANGTYVVTVGSGGARTSNGSSIQAPGGSGGFSNIAFPSAIRAEGGGGGGHVGGPGGDGQPGGSGGGGNYPGGTRSSGNRQSPHSSTPVPNQGYPGGVSSTPANFGAGGGGGAGAAGADGGTGDGGDGGTGKQNTATGVTLSLAGGGGGNIYYPSTTVGDATHGGGQGAPHSQVAPTTGPTSINGHSNTGGGGGGGLRHSGAGPQTGIGPDTPSSNTGQAGQGGSGIVIIAYPT